MTGSELERYLSAIVKAGPIYNDKGKPGGHWDEDFGGLVVSRERNFVELSYQDSGVGEDYVAFAFRHRWPDRTIDVDTNGGCDSCGYGRTISITISGATPPWESPEPQEAVL